jgi:hypothetical protein
MGIVAHSLPRRSHAKSLQFHFHILEEVVYGYESEYREFDHGDEEGKIPRLMRFYLFVACMVMTHLVFDLVKTSPVLDGLYSITRYGICQFIPCSLCMVYCGIFFSHSAMLKKKYNIYGYIEEIATADGSTLPSPPRDSRSFISITMSHLKTEMYLVLLGVALMGVDMTLTKLSGHHYSFLCPILYFLGFFLYAYNVFHYRTNAIMLGICINCWIFVYFPVFVGFYSEHFKRAFPGYIPVVGAASVTSAAPSVTGDSTVSVEMGTTGLNLVQDRNRDVGGTDATANQPDKRLVAITAPGIIYDSDYFY